MAKLKAKRDLLAGAMLADIDLRHMSITTPEGVVLPFELAPFVTRILALFIDALIIVIVPIILSFSLFALVPQVDFNAHKAANDILSVIIIAFLFFMRTGYFMAFEMGPHAATPGKRIMGLRVIAHDGGSLTPSSLFIRNAMREVELYLPIQILIMGISNSWIAVIAFFWAIMLLFLPLFNKEQARLGDFLGGTRVVKMPKLLLSYDLVDRDMDVATGLIFTDEQLKIYGEKELILLEEVLRERRGDMMRVVADKIKARIGWREASNALDEPTDEHFLRAYYGALRAYLESRMLFGKRKKDKYDESLR